MIEPKMVFKASSRTKGYMVIQTRKHSGCPESSSHPLMRDKITRRNSVISSKRQFLKQSPGIRSLQSISAKSLVRLRSAEDSKEREKAQRARLHWGPCQQEEERLHTRGLRELLKKLKRL